MTNYRTTFAKSGVLFARFVQGTAFLLSIVFMGGGLAGDMDVFAFVFLGFVSLFLLVAVLVVEFVLIRPVQRRWGGASDA